MQTPSEPIDAGLRPGASGNAASIHAYSGADHEGPTLVEAPGGAGREVPPSPSFFLDLRYWYLPSAKSLPSAFRLRVRPGSGLGGFPALSHRASSLRTDA
jgi:hypothetical protein